MKNRNVFDVDPNEKMRSEGPVDPPKAEYVEAVAKVREKLEKKKEPLNPPWCFVHWSITAEDPSNGWQDSERGRSSLKVSGALS